MDLVILGTIFLLGAGPSCWRLFQFFVLKKNPYEDFEHPEAR